MTGGAGKEHGTNKPPPTGRVQETSKGDTTCPTTSQNPCWHPSWLSNVYATRKGSESEQLAKDNLEINPITIKPETVSHTAKQFPWVPLPYCSPPGLPFPIKSLALSAHVSPRTIHFWVLDKSPLLGPGRDPPSCNRRIDTEVEVPILWPPDAKSQLIAKDPDAGKDWGQEEKGTIEDEMVGWHQWLNAHEFEQSLGNSEGQGSLACCSYGATKSQTRFRDWTTTQKTIKR